MPQDVRSNLLEQLPQQPRVRLLAEQAAQRIERMGMGGEEPASRQRPVARGQRHHISVAIRAADTDDDEILLPAHAPRPWPVPAAAMGPIDLVKVHRVGTADLAMMQSPTHGRTARDRPGWPPMSGVMHLPPLGPVDYAACARHLDELRRIRDHDLPDLLCEAWALAAPDAPEEVLQAQADLEAVVARIAELEDLLERARAWCGAPHTAPRGSWRSGASHSTSTG